MKCVYCKIKEARKKYCSVSCIKRAYILRKFPKTHSYYNYDILFWKTETGIGFKWEQYSAKLLKAEHIPFNNGPDLIHKKMGGIDVKVCTKYFRKKKRGKLVKNNGGWWVFNSNIKKDSVKWIFCICLNLDSSIEKQLLIPSEIFYTRKTGITVGDISKFDIYKYI